MEEDLWIGDRVQLIKSQRVGIYEGQNPNGKHRIKIDDKIILSSISNLIKVKEEKIKKKIDLAQFAKKPGLQFADFDKQIDLHAEKLDPDLFKQPPQMILRHQLNACHKHIEQAISVGAKIITIIHGKGKGELRKEVDYILSQYPEIHFSNLINNGGATEVWLR